MVLVRALVLSVLLSLVLTRATYWWFSVPVDIQLPFVLRPPSLPFSPPPRPIPADPRVGDAINVVFPLPEMDWIIESQFMTEVLLSAALAPRPLVFHRWAHFDAGRPETWGYLNDSIIFAFVGDCFGVPCGRYLERVRADGARNVGIFHMGDEQHAVDVAFYRHADYVLRNYYFADILVAHPHAIWVPNGYSNGVGPQDRRTVAPLSARPNECQFGGRKTGYRDAFVNTVRGHCEIEYHNDFGGGLPRAEYAKVLLGVKLAPCPFGNSNETIRLYDALECGALPVMVRCPFTDYVMGSLGPRELPFVVISDWSLFALVKKDLLRDPKSLDDLQRSSQAWWARLQASKRLEIRAAVDRSFAATK